MFLNEYKRYIEGCENFNLKRKNLSCLSQLFFACFLNLWKLDLIFAVKGTLTILCFHCLGLHALVSAGILTRMRDHVSAVRPTGILVGEKMSPPLGFQAIWTYERSPV